TTARALGDRIAVMHDGRVVQVGTPETIFERPATPFVARFTGSNCVPATVWKEAVAGGDTDEGEPVGTDASLAIRPEHVVLGDGGLSATVERATREDNGVRVALARDGSTVEAYATSPPPAGEETTVRFPGEHVVRLGGDDDGTG
ncbi:MAG TPA: TOBE domain-containing protein, partial [Halobacteriales archaeon]|nr:TOBE domain-containing protein [Halobacteriales archaeon]